MIKFELDKLVVKDHGNFYNLTELTINKSKSDFADAEETNSQSSNRGPRVYYHEIIIVRTERIHCPDDTNSRSYFGVLLDM